MVAEERKRRKMEETNSSGGAKDRAVEKLRSNPGVDEPQAARDHGNSQKEVFDSLDNLF